MSIAPLARTGFVLAFGLAFALSRLLGGEARERVASRGILQSFDPATQRLTMRMEPDGVERSFSWDETTRFYDNDGPIVPQALKIGQQVCVVAPRKKAAAIASRVEVEPIYSPPPTADA